MPFRQPFPGFAGRLMRLAVVASAGLTAALHPGPVRSDLPQSRGTTGEPSTAEVATLIGQLGDPDYAVRELASHQLQGLGAAVADQLLAAAEESPDLEVKLRARWLAESIPFATGQESPEAAGLLQSFSAGDLTERVRIMQRLLRLDDDAGIEPLARIVRLERTAAGSHIAAGLLVQDWHSADPFWPRLAPRILAGLGNSSRPTARFLRGLVAHATADSPAAASRAVDDCAEAAVDLKARMGAVTEKSDRAGRRATGPIRGLGVFQRCLAELLASDGRRAAALAAAEPLLTVDGRTAVGAARLAIELQWLAAHGLPEAVDLVPADLLTDDVNPLIAYAAAIAWQTRGGEDAAATAAKLADLASSQLDGHDLVYRLDVAPLLARWGGIEWAIQEYTLIINSHKTGPAERALAAISYSELLHDQQRDAEAAAVLQALLDPGQGEQQTEEIEQGLEQLGREPRSIRSRMLFFAACGEPHVPTRQQLLEESLGAYPNDVDTLIALFRLAENEPDRRAKVMARITDTAAVIDKRIRDLPEDSVSQNEYAWLIANTEGDLAKATRYSRASLVDAFDTASYLDTLAHCHAAAGNLERAVRTQWLAVKKDPHSLLIRHNFERFRSLAGVQP